MDDTLAVTATPRTGGPGRAVTAVAGVRRRLLGPAGGAVVAQLTQALASFGLQIAAARTLGIRGLGVFALLYGATVLATAICTGLVGDSLTVLPRLERRVRAGLQSWCITAAAVCGAAAAVISWAAGLLTAVAAVTFALATAVFVVEDALRRLLMAVGRFWSLPFVDLTALVGALAVVLAARESGAHLTVGTFMLALLAGQLVACLAAVVRLPTAERFLVSLRDADLRTVFAFGFWRSAAQAVRPSILTAVRVVITTLTSVAVYGQLEAARVYMAPALLVVGGVGSFLLPTYVRRLDDGPAALVRRADKAALGLLVGSLVMGGVAVALIPLLGTVVAGHGIEVGTLAVFAWSVYAASTAAVMPYGSLAAVLGEPSKIMIYRLVEAALSIGAVAAVLAVSRGVVAWTPALMAAGPVAGGWGIRRLVLLPLIRRAAQPVTAEPDLDLDLDLDADLATVIARQRAMRRSAGTSSGAHRA